MLRHVGASTRGRPAYGFSLIELIVAISLLAVLVRLATPAFGAWIANSQVRTVAESLQTGIRTAQAEAVRRNRQVVLSFTNLTPTLNVAAVASGKNWSIQTWPQFGDTAEYITGGAFSDQASGVTIASTPSASMICFNSNGRLVTNPSNSCSVTAANYTFDVTKSGADRNLRVIVQVGGQLRLCDPKRTLSPSTPDGC